MRKEFLVYQNKVYSNFVNYINDYILLSKDPAMLEEGYVPYSSYVDDAGEGVYGKLVPYSEVSQRYSVYDSVLYKGQEFAMAGHKRGDDDFTAPDSYVRILVSDKEFLNFFKSSKYFSIFVLLSQIRTNLRFVLLTPLIYNIFCKILYKLRR